MKLWAIMVMLVLMITIMVATMLMIVVMMILMLLLELTVVDRADDEDVNRTGKYVFCSIGYDYGDDNDDFGTGDDS